MSRRAAALLAFAALLGLTALTAVLPDAGASAGLLLGVATVKTCVIGAVFLELDHAHPGWSVLGAILVIGLACGVVWVLP